MSSLTQFDLLKKYGLSIRGLRGQHLLIDPNIQRKIVELLEAKPGERIVEIGPGLGALTGEILVRGAKVLAIETDRKFCEILEAELGEKYPRKLKIINEDVLKTDLASWIASPAGTASLSDASRPRNDRIKVISNLPYYITTPVLFWLIKQRKRIGKAVLMMQREVARRLTAMPGEKDYGRLTLAVRYRADARKAFDVSKNCFTPKPDVGSTVVILTFHPSSKFPPGMDEDFLFHVIQIAFGARRKTLLSRLVHAPSIQKSRNEILGIFEQLGILATARAEDLLLKDFMALSQALR